MTKLVVASALAVCMIVASIGAATVSGNRYPRNLHQPTRLYILPIAFSGWSRLVTERDAIVDPRSPELVREWPHIDYLQGQPYYTGTFVDPEDHRVMLSISLREDLHHEDNPEDRYAVDGFTIKNAQNVSLTTDIGDIAVTRFTASLPHRSEVVTYWTQTNGQVATGLGRLMGSAKVWRQFSDQYDDLIFRVSSIDEDSARAFAVQQKFVNDLLSSVTPLLREQLVGNHVLETRKTL